MAGSVFIGGASQSGKSTLARLIADQCGMQHVALDNDRLITKLRPYLKTRLGYYLARRRAAYMINNQPAGTVSEVSFFTPLQLKQTLRRDPQRIIVFVGCPTIVIADKIALLRANNFRHSQNLRALDDQRLERAIGKLKTLSIKHQMECQTLGIPFFDTSQVSNMTQVQAQAATWVQAQLARTGDM